MYLNKRNLNFFGPRQGVQSSPIEDRRALESSSLKESGILDAPAPMFIS